jgi:hypothetical protein
VRVPFSLLVTKHIIVSVKLNQKGPYRMIFDTGAPISLLNSRTAKETGLIAKGGGGFNLFGSLEQVKVKDLQLGDLKAKNVPVVVMDHPTVELASKLWGPIEGILGFPFFARYRMTLDYQSKEMTFVPNGYQPGDILQRLMSLLLSDESPAAAVSPGAGLWGFAVEKAANDDQAGVLVSRVYPNSPAARGGLRAGDRLLSLDDRWTDSLADSDAAIGSVKAGTSVRLRILRDKREIELAIKPESGL